MTNNRNQEDRQEMSSRLRLAIALSLSILLLEVAGGIASNSLALLTDSAHVFLDIFALALSYFAVRLTMRPATLEATFGLHRAEVLAALTNGAVLAVVASMVFYFAYGRLLNPPHVSASVMLAIAVIGLVGNLYVAYRIRGYRSLIVRSAYLHVLGDAFTSVAVIVGGIAIQIAEAEWIDPLLSFFIAAVIIFGASRIVLESYHILMEKTPRHVSPEEIEQDILEVKGVQGIHDLHLWSISSNLHALSVHIVLDDATMPKSARVLQAVTDHLRSKHGIEHTTIQIEVEHCGHKNV